jgi:hypothetical protein
MLLTWKDQLNWYIDTFNKDVMFRIEMALHLAPKNDTKYWNLMKEADQKYKTLERFHDVVFSPRKKNQINYANTAYSQHVFINTAVYYGIKLNAPDIKLNQTQIDLATNYFTFMHNKGKIQSSIAPTMGQFYKHEFNNINNIQLNENMMDIDISHDFLN